MECYTGLKWVKREYSLPQTINLIYQNVSKGEDTLWNISFRLFHETQLNVYFITFNLISWNSLKICKKEASSNYDRKKMGTKENQVFSLLLVEHVFSEKTTKQKTKQKRSVWVKPSLKNCMYTSAFKNIFAELIVNDKEEFRRYLRISTATYHYFFLAWQNNGDVLYYTSLPAAAAAFVQYLTFIGTARWWRNAINCYLFLVL